MVEFSGREEEGGWKCEGRGREPEEVWSEAEWWEKYAGGWVEGNGMLGVWEIGRVFWQIIR